VRNAKIYKLVVGLGTTFTQNYTKRKKLETQVADLRSLERINTTITNIQEQEYTKQKQEKEIKSTTLIPRCSPRSTYDQGITYFDPGSAMKNKFVGWVDSDFRSDVDSEKMNHGLFDVAEWWTYFMEIISARRCDTQ
jgi:hypothetical protein